MIFLVLCITIYTSTVCGMGPVDPKCLDKEVGDVGECVDDRSYFAFRISADYSPEMKTNKKKNKKKVRKHATNIIKSSLRIHSLLFSCTFNTFKKGETYSCYLFDDDTEVNDALGNDQYGMVFENFNEYGIYIDKVLIYDQGNDKLFTFSQSFCMPKEWNKRIGGYTQNDNAVDSIQCTIFTGHNLFKSKGFLVQNDWFMPKIYLVFDNIVDQNDEARVFLSLDDSQCLIHSNTTPWFGNNYNYKWDKYILYGLCVLFICTVGITLINIIKKKRNKITQYTNAKSYDSDISDVENNKEEEQFVNK